MISPTKQPLIITQKFGANPQVYKKFGMKGHNGIDIRARYIPIYATLPGITKLSIDSNGYGKSVSIVTELKDKPFNWETIYAHLITFSIKAGQKVKKGEVIGISGNTGFSTAPHLHWGMRQRNKKGGVINYGNGFYGWTDVKPHLEYWKIGYKFI